MEAIGTSQWTTVYSRHRGADGNGGYFCALVDEKKVPDVMSRDSWDLMIGNGLPGFSQSYGGKKPVTKYHRFGGHDGIEPLVLVRSFHGLKADYIELLEEFRHLLNLYYDKHNDRYLRFDDSGGEEVVAEVSRDSVRIKTRPLRQFLGVRGMCLAVFFDSVAFSSAGVDDVAPAMREQSVTRPDLRYSFHIGDRTLGDRPFSRLLGKRLVTPLPIEECGIWPYEEKPKPHIEFIIGLDKDGKEVSHTCDPEKLANFFGKNAGAPHYLTPVVFRREVLRKYYDNPEKYEVDDGYLHCAGLWALRLDNHSEDRVTVFLGDLGQSLGHEEQLHWRSCNIPPLGDGKDISETTRRRAFDAEFADPTAPELVFKSALASFQEQWEKRFGWHLVRPVREEDIHVFKKLHVPTTKSMVEFEDQLLGLTKLLVDSLNDKEIAKALGGALPDEKSIAKLERFLMGKNYPSTKRDIDLLRLLQEGRSSIAAHRKGDSFKKVAEKLGLATQTPQDVFSTLLRGAIEMLEDLTAFFLAPAAE
ncbi:hypothetical protein [Labilithrix luteola]|uniref:hypothetical protein n=1 Tax=Labilithrix luteola TaxID=1391654 RepID=UPI0011BA9DE4|nr:hypothetical protein [Labilithrix luteola]